MKGAYTFNETIDFSKIGTTGDFISKIPFMSKNTRFDSLDIDVSSGVIRYNNIDVYTSQGWTHQKYRTITLFEEQDDNEWSPSQQVVEEWILANSTAVTTKKRVKLTKTKEDGTADQEEIYPKAYVTDLMNEDGSQWIPSLGGSGGMGGGGSGAVSITTITNPELVTSLGVKTELEFEWSSEADGNGTLYIYVDGELKKTALAKQGKVKVDVSNYITSATDYLVRLVVEDAFGSKRALNYQVSVINLIVNSTFDQTLAQTGAITYRYTPYGSVTKTMHFFIDGVEYTRQVEETGREQTFEIPNGTLTHGVHTLKVYATATFGETTVYSNELNYKFAYYQEGNSTPIIVIFNEPNQTFDEGQTVKINYLVYTATSETTNITLDLNGYIQRLTVDRQAKVWSITDYNQGINTIKIATDTNYETITFNIVASEITITPVTTGLQLFLSSNGKSNNVSSKDKWTYGEIETTFNNFNFVSDGWLEDSDGIVGLKMTGDANIEIGYKPFGDDAKKNGKTIELEFATSNVTNFDATVINIMSDNRGILVKPNEIFLKSTGKGVSTRFKEEEHIRISLVIERSTANRFISVYINGVLSGIDVYGSDDNFQQPEKTAVNIKAGSTECDLTLYKIRCYNNSLTASNILDNYIADNDKYDLKTKLYRRNQIYDAYGTVLYNKVKNIMPVLLITAPILPNSEDDVRKLTSLKLENINNPQLNWEYTNLDFEVQGTSSLQYPVKNLEFKFGEDVIQLYPDAIPENRLTLKVDYASSAGVFNMGNAKIVNELYQEKNPRQDEDSRVRNALYGYPVAVFYRKTPSDNWQFHCKGSLNLSKKANAMGYKEGDESWETKNNTSALCLFKTDDFRTLSSDFEARYNKSGSSKNLETLIKWVYDCRNDPQLFRDDCEKHFNLHYLLMYYVYGQIMGGADSYAKNLYLTFFAEGQNEDGTYYGKWYPQFYDLDTSYGINNTGELKFEYSAELQDKYGENYAFNGHDSVLWKLVEQAYADELKDLYQILRNGQIVTYDSIMEILQVQGIEQYPEAIYNEDAQIKYIDPYLAGIDYLDTALGSTLEHLKYWVANRLKYLDSKWIASSYSTDRISARITTPEGATKDYSITLKSKDDMYMQIQQGSYYANVRANRNQEYTLVPDLQENTEFNDTETYIYGASSLTYISDLSKWYLSLLKLGAATSLTEIKVGDSSANYENPNLTTLEFGANKLLRSIDISNCSGLTGNIDLSQCTNLQYLYAGGTQLTSVSFANGGQLKIAVLPDTITSMTLINLTSIQSITTTGVYSTIRIEHSNVDSLDYVKKSIAASKLERLRLLGINWTIESKDMLDYLVENVKGINSIGNNQDKSVLSGKIHITGSIFSDEITEFREYWGTSLTITADNIIQRYRCRFYDYDGTLLYQTSVYKGESVAYIGKTPHRPIDEVNKVGYLFAGWDKSQNNIQKDTDFHPVFNAKPMVKATFVNYDGTVLYVDEVIAGTKAEYGGLTPEKPRDYDLQIKYVFKEWKPNINVAIEDNTTFTPVWDEIDFYKVEWQNYDGTVLETDYVDYNQKATYNGETPTRPTDAQYVYTFSGWSPNPENTAIVANTTFTAGYSLKALCKVTLLNADGTVFDEIGVGNGEQFDYHSKPTPPDDDAQFRDYKFASWQLNGVDVTLPITVTTNITLTPRFEGTLRKYSVFWFVEGELKETDIDVAYGTVGVTYDGVTPEKDGYVFSGWNTVENAEEGINTSTYQVVGDTYMYAVFLDKYAAATVEIDYNYTKKVTSTSYYIDIVQFYNTSDGAPTDLLQVDLDDGNGWQNIADSGTAVANFSEWEGMSGKSYRKFKIMLPAREIGNYKVKIKYLEGLEFAGWSFASNHALSSAYSSFITKIKYSYLMKYLIGGTSISPSPVTFIKNCEIIYPENIIYYRVGGIIQTKSESYELNFPNTIQRIDGGFSLSDLRGIPLIVRYNKTFEEFLNSSKLFQNVGTLSSFYFPDKVIFNDKEVFWNSEIPEVDIDLSNVDVSKYYLIQGLKCINKLTLTKTVGISFVGTKVNKINSDEDYVWDYSRIEETYSQYPPLGFYNFTNSEISVQDGVKKLIVQNKNASSGGGGSSYGYYVFSPISVKVENLYFNGSLEDYISLSIPPVPQGSEGCNFYFNGELLTDEEYTVPESITSLGYGAFAYMPFKKIIFHENVNNRRNTFEGMPNIEEIVNLKILQKNDFALCKNENITLTNYTGTSIIMPEGLFANAIIEKPFLPEGMTVVDDYSLSTIANKLYIPDGITQINANGCNTSSDTKTIIIPSSVTNIASRALYCGSKTRAYTYVFKGNTPPTIASNSLSGTGAVKEIIVPTDALEAYQGTTNLTSYASKIVGGAENYD